MPINYPIVPLDEWHQRILHHADGAANAGLPPLPSRAIQQQFVGSSLRPAFEEAFAFYQTFQGYAAALGMRFQSGNARLLDFGCGWGRFLRYAMNDFPQSNLHAVDIDPSIIDACSEAGIPAQFQVIEPLGNLPFQDGFFSHAMAYSVFTHLPENVHLNWSAEIIRVLQPGGIFCGTIETRKFLEFIQKMPDDEAESNDWYRALTRYKGDTAKLLAEYDQGQFVYLPTGGGGVRTNDVYGEAVVPPRYIEKHWNGASLRAVIDENFWQTVIVVQKD